MTNDERMTKSEARMNPGRRLPFGIRALCLVILSSFVIGHSSFADDPVRSFEKEIAEHPLEAFSIARRAADALAGRPDQVKKLFALGARLQEERLKLLSENQIGDLANVYAKTLDDARAAERVQQRWLKLRRDSLGPADGPGRVSLARLYQRWFQDREAAAQLCKEALRVAPETQEAARMLREELRYRHTARGWLPSEQIDPANQRRNLAKVRPGASAEDVLQLLGDPNRIARQILYQRYLEQWQYDKLPGMVIVLNCAKGQQDAHVWEVHQPK
jgi:hypothetical protein